MTNPVIKAPGKKGYRLRKILYAQYCCVIDSYTSESAVYRTHKYLIVHTSILSSPKKHWIRLHISLTHGSSTDFWIGSILLHIISTCSEHQLPSQLRSFLRIDSKGQHQVGSVFFVIVAQCRLYLEMGFSSETIQYKAAVFTGWVIEDHRPLTSQYSNTTWVIPATPHTHTHTHASHSLQHHKHSSGPQHYSFTPTTFCIQQKPCVEVKQFAFLLCSLLHKFKSALLFSSRFYNRCTLLSNVHRE